MLCRLILALCLCAAFPALANVVADGRYEWPVLGVVDGDTLNVHLPGLPMELQPVKVRLRGIDTPELRGKCASEKNMARAARDFTQRLVETALAADRPIYFSRIDWDKYGGRIDAEVAVDGRSLSDMLVGAGLARRYDGGKRMGWCG